MFYNNIFQLSAKLNYIHNTRDTRHIIKPNKIIFLKKVYDWYSLQLWFFQQLLAIISSCHRT